MESSKAFSRGSGEFGPAYGETLGTLFFFPHVSRCRLVCGHDFPWVFGIWLGLGGGFRIYVFFALKKENYMCHRGYPPEN